MGEFTPLTLKDKSMFDAYALRGGARTVEANFACAYIWNHKYHSALLPTPNALYVRYTLDNAPMIRPVGVLDWKTAVEEMRENAPEATLCDLSEEDRLALESAMPGAFVFTERREVADYLYSCDDLADLPGKKYHSKRNHCSRFEREYAGRWVYEPIHNTNIDDVWLFHENWCRKNDCSTNLTLQEEGTSIALLIYNLTALDAHSGLLRVDDKVVAFAAGTMIGADGLDVHIEKADYDVPGSYAMICREFAKSVRPRVRWINREDDMGLENLRKAKLSYYPAEILNKYSAAPAR